MVNVEVTVDSFYDICEYTFRDNSWAREPIYEHFYN